MSNAELETLIHTPATIEQMLTFVACTLALGLICYGIGKFLVR